MANRERGEVAVTVGGKEYTLVLKLNEMVALETVLSTPDQRVRMPEVWQEVMQDNQTYCRAVIWASLRKHHKGMTLEQVGELIDQADNGVSDFIIPLLVLKASMLPDVEDQKTMAATDSPQTPHQNRGTGAAATSTQDVSASPQNNSGT